MESDEGIPKGRNSLRLLSIDGEWIAGFPQLFIVREIMKAIDPQTPPKPCDIFDLICGTSSGGLIAIMLGRMRMTVDEAIVSSTWLESSSFVRSSHRWRFDTRGKLGCLNNSADLSRDLQEMISHHGIRADELLCEPAQRSPITLVTAQRIDNESLELFSSDPFQEHDLSHGMTVLEAARITSTTSAYFAPVVVGPSQTRYMSGEMLAKNPINETLKWVKQKWPHATISTLVSIGSGDLYKSRFLKNPGTPPSYWVPYARDPEEVAAIFLLENREMALTGSYFRFTLPVSEHIDLNNLKAMSELPLLDKVWQEQRIFLTIERCAEKLRRLNGPSPREKDTRKEIDVPKRVEEQAVSAMERRLKTSLASLVLNRKPLEELAETTARLLLDDTEMRFLLLAAIDKIANVRLKKNLAILLEDFAQRLKTVSNLEFVAHFVGSRKLDIVYQLLRRLQRGSQCRVLTSLPSYEDVMFANDEIQDLMETPRKFRNTEIGLVVPTLSQLEDAVSRHSPSFTEMKEDLRRFIFPSMKSYIREIILPVLPATNRLPIYSVAVRVHWELEEYLCKEFDANVDIDDIITLTGEVAYAQALPCGEYMRQSWPRTGAATLAAIKYALLRGYSYHQYSPTHSIQLEFEESETTASEEGDATAFEEGEATASEEGEAIASEEGEATVFEEGEATAFEKIEATASEKSEATASEEGVTAKGRALLVLINGKPMEVVETIEQFAWFASAFRSVGESTTGLSRVDFRIASEPSESQEVMTELSLLPLRTCIHTEPSYGSCWLSLITSSALAWGFPIKERRGQAVGLEMPFQQIFKACGARFPVEFQDSIIIRQGPLTIYPIAKHHDGVQWHVVDGGLDAFFKTLEAYPILSMEGNIDLFSKTRTFLGWLTHAHVRLGTVRPTDRASGTDEDKGRGRMLGDEGTLNLNVKFPLVDLVSGTIGRKMIYQKTQMQRTKTIQLGYERAITRSARTPAIYYDSIDGTGWLVPELSLILHVVYAFLIEHRPNLEALHRIPYAKQCGNGAENTIAVIKETESIVLWKVGADNKDFRFRDLIEDHLIAFDERKESMRSTLETHQLRSDGGLRGWDFVDLRDNTAQYHCRLIPGWIGRPQWWDLAKNPNVAVVFGANLAQVIVPDRSSPELCSLWTEIPPKCGLLVGSVRCIEHMCRQWEAKLPEKRLANDLAWHQPEHSNPFAVCTGHGCNPVQKLRNLKTERFRGLRNPQRIAVDGAVIFGRPEDVKKHISRALPCAPLPVQDVASQDRIYLATRARPDSYALVVLNWFKYIFEALAFRSIVPRAVFPLCVAIVMGWMFRVHLDWSAYT